MRIENDFFSAMLDIDKPDECADVVWRAGRPTGVEALDGEVVVYVPFYALKRSANIENDPEVVSEIYHLHVRSYGGEILRLTLANNGRDLPDDTVNVMLDWDRALKQDRLEVRTVGEEYRIIDETGRTRLTVNIADPVLNHWSNLIQAPPPAFDVVVSPDGSAVVPFMAYDTFYPGFADSFPLGFVNRAGSRQSIFFALHADSTESFAGTGERFSRMDLAGQTISLFNEDGLGVNSRRAYKNIPFYVSSRGYGLLALTSAHSRFSFADISTRTVHGLVDESMLDLFFIGGGSPERIVNNYRRLTGYPSSPPLWSYGTWMGRMSYMSAVEAEEVARRLRDEDLPCDVIHLDTGWFEKDWQCDWRFSPVTFPEPKAFLARLRDEGFHVSLWQMPTISKENSRFEEASSNGYLARKRARGAASEFGGVEYAGAIDFSNPEAVVWYQGMLHELLSLGAAAIKTDFGESIDLEAEYFGMAADQLHNIYSLLYQKAAFEQTVRTTGDKLIWARSGWVGSQRYPIHWSGDAACSWDGLSGSLRGGLHLGVSGFGFWSADVPGTHGVPNFMNSWPSDELYIRWTQFGVLSSHLRYHGMQPREPYNYPGAAPTVRKWLKLRYALLPYLVQQGKQTTFTGKPVLRAMLFEHPDDPRSWHVDDQYYLGDDMLVAPVMSAKDVRDVYLPAGEWIDLWTGETHVGPEQLMSYSTSLERAPIFVRKNARIPVYPDPVQHTGQMDMSKTVSIVFDSSYKGLANTILGEITGLS